MIMGVQEMLYGSTLVKCCSECSGHIEEQSILSGNTFGATYWTDGKMEAPMLPAVPRLVKCPHCMFLLWIAELEVIDEYEGTHSRDICSKAKPFLKPAFGDYMSFLESVSLAPQAERYIRITAWRKGNDKRRRSQIQSSLSRKEIGNIKVLEGLIDLSIGEDYLMAAEIKRELGLFSESEELLKGITDKQLTLAAKTVESLAQRKDQYVRQIVYEG